MIIDDDGDQIVDGIDDEESEIEYLTADVYAHECLDVLRDVRARI